MRRLCISVALVPSLLLATAPAHAATNVGHRQAASASSSQQRAMTPRATRTRTAHRVHNYTYGRT